MRGIRRDAFEAGSCQFIQGVGIVVPHLVLASEHADRFAKLFELIEGNIGR